MVSEADISIETLRSYFLKHTPFLGEIVGLEKFSTGQSNPTYKARFERGYYVLRSKPPGDLLKSAHQVDREFRVMKALKDTGVPVPEMVHLVDDGNSPIGRSFFLMEYFDGRIFWDPIIPECDTSERACIYLEMARVLASLHSLNLESVGLENFGRPGNYFHRQTTRWYEQYKNSAFKLDEDMIYLADWLLGNMPEDDGQTALVHGDYRLDNMIFEESKPKVLALLDWELATLGHPLADLAYQCMQWRLPHNSTMSGLGGLERKEFGIPAENDYVSSYCEYRNCSAPDNWSFYLLFSYFRLTAILQGVVRRAVDGNGSNPEIAKTYEKSIPILIGQANGLLGR